jgi:hypothetical protein
MDPRTFRPTAEQSAIIQTNASGEDQVVIARAGTGKTSTLEWGSHVDTTQALYIVFNAANRKEAQRRFPTHVKPVTGHSLAFRPMIAQNDGFRRKFDNANGGKRILPMDISDAAELNGYLHGASPTQQAALVLRTIGRFQHSADDRIDAHHVPEDAIPKRFLKPSSQNEKQDLIGETVKASKAIWDRMANDSDPFPILHDTYLKLFSLRDPDITSRGRFQRILADEWQDANPVLARILDRQHAQKIYVGDPHQQIYSWRGAVNALKDKQESGVATNHLSTSFRFGNQVAAAANILLESVGETTLMRGAGPQAQPFDDQQPHAVIGRKNITLFEKAVEAIETETPFALVGGAQDIIRLLESGLALREGRMDQVKDPDLKLYSSWAEAKEISDMMQDGAMNALITVIDRYGRRALDFVDDLERAGQVDERSVNLVLTTAHRSKGREFDQTVLCEDMALGEDILGKIKQGTPLTAEEQESMNVLYVAATRCRHGMKFEPDVRDEFKQIREFNRANRANRVNAKIDGEPEDTMGEHSQPSPGPG